LAEELDRLMDGSTRDAMSQAALSVAHRDAAAEVAQLVEQMSAADHRGRD
jgi:UDP-N-acetylglucosamine:LPS N-acetylglucosamine transferase